MGTMQNRWLLPEAIDELLPPHAQQLETSRRQILDLYRSWGYQLIMPPMVEFLDALLTGVGSDLDTQTFKLTDQASGRLLGVRADMTPQAARIDAHQLKHNDINRLCYFGTVLRTKAAGIDGVRNPMQVGAELFGSASSVADVEIASLLLETLDILGEQQVLLDISHVKIISELVRLAGLDSSQQTELFTLLQRKAIPLLLQFGARHDLDAKHTQWFVDLAELDLQVTDSIDATLSLARQKFAGCSSEIDAALHEIAEFVAALQQRYPQVQLHIDLAELTGYHYQTGLVFAAFVADVSQAVARGGRYDGIGADFGQARPATGFSVDIKCLLNKQALSATDYNGNSSQITQAQAADSLASIAERRANGEIVCGYLPPA